MNDYMRNYQKSCLDRQFANDRRCSCYAVYHENRTGNKHLEGIITDSNAYFVPKVRRRSWHAFDGQTHAVYEGFNYGSLPVDTFISLIKGQKTSVPGAYGTKTAKLRRIDFISNRSFDGLYANDCHRVPSLRKKLRRNIDVVVHYFKIPASKRMTSSPVCAVAVRAGDYGRIDWKEVEHAVLSESPLPDEVLCAGSPRTVTSFLDNDRLYTAGTCNPSHRAVLSSCRWCLEITHPADFAMQLVRRAKLGVSPDDLVECDWSNYQVALSQITKLLAMCGENPIVGAVGGVSIQWHGLPKLILVIECDKPSHRQKLAYLYGATAGEIVPIFSDRDVYGLMRSECLPYGEIASWGTLGFQTLLGDENFQREHIDNDLLLHPHYDGPKFPSEEEDVDETRERLAMWK